jgi:predicted DNA-binding transcriptional regulator YafY
MSARRNAGLRRILGLMQRLDGLVYAPTLDELAVELKVSERTVRRDLELLEAVGQRVPRWRQNQRDGV